MFINITPTKTGPELTAAVVRHTGTQQADNTLCHVLPHFPAHKYVIVKVTTVCHSHKTPMKVA